MRRILLLVMVILTGSALLATTYDAEAGRRFGGGKSSGLKRQAPPEQAQSAPTVQPQSNPMANGVRAGGMSRWFGPLAAFGLGAVLMSMFGGSALLGAIANVLMIALLVMAGMFVFNMLKRKGAANTSAPLRYATAASGTQPSPHSVAASFSPAPPSAEPRFPLDFDVAGFERQAKVSFMRLQAANDAKDLRDIRDYTTPEMYAEIAMQLQERGDEPQTTEVVSVEAKVIEVANEAGRQIASVRFTGVIREDVGGAATSLDETWHVVKDGNDRNAPWLIAGIQQN